MLERRVHEPAISFPKHHLARGTGLRDFVTDSQSGARGGAAITLWYEQTSSLLRAADETYRVCRTGPKRSPNGYSV